MFSHKSVDLTLKLLARDAHFQRSSKNTKLENFLTEMRRMTLIHERDSHGEEQDSSHRGLVREASHATFGGRQHMGEAL